MVCFKVMLLSQLSPIGKSELDGEFSHPKGVVRDKSFHGAGVGPTPANPTTGVGTADALMEIFATHRLFSPQFTPTEKDTQGFTLVKRYASLLDSTQSRFGKYGFKYENKPFYRPNCNCRRNPKDDGITIRVWYERYLQRHRSKKLSLIH